MISLSGTKKILRAEPQLSKSLNKRSTTSQTMEEETRTITRTDTITITSKRINPSKKIITLKKVPKSSKLKLSKGRDLLISLREMRKMTLRRSSLNRARPLKSKFTKRKVKPQKSDYVSTRLLLITLTKSLKSLDKRYLGIKSLKKSQDSQQAKESF